MKIYQRQNPVLGFLAYAALSWLFMVGSSFVFGGLLAKLEIDLEIKNNYQVLKKAYRAVCSDLNDGVPQTDLFVALFGADASIPLPLTFNWMKCEWPGISERYIFPHDSKLNFEDDHDQQVARYLVAFELEMQYNISNNETKNDILNSASVGEGCNVDWANGALLWFSIMTAIGGKQLPVTDGGRLLVMTAGFVTLIVSFYLSHMSAEFFKIMWDDWFLRKKWKLLISGPFSMLFWFCVYSGWLLIVAQGLQATARKAGDDLTWSEAFYVGNNFLFGISFGGHELDQLPVAFLAYLKLVGFIFLDICYQKTAECYKAGVTAFWDGASGALQRARNAGRHWQGSMRRVNDCHE